MRREKGMRMDVDDLGVNVIGIKTLDYIEKTLEEQKEKGVTGIVVNFKGKGINPEYTEKLARMKYEYGCKYLGEGNKKYDIDAYIKTGYFIKEKMGRVAYLRWLKRQVEQADYPLMIRDNRMKAIRTVEMNIIQPLKFDDRYFYFNVIKPKLLEPEDLELAIAEGEEIYTKETILIEDLLDLNEGFRFAGTFQERCILDVFEDIITERVTGYREVPIE